ncbi:MAG: HK97 gp10 family phage protein [Desulfomonile tiedjei]|nr:HK97 gp10 family phage protein [Desulfomonile tiedjei]
MDIEVVTADFNVLTKLETLLPRAINLGLHDFMRTMLGEIQGRSPYWTGALTRSWKEETTEKGFTVGTDLPYAIVLEEGRYKGVGPRTAASGGGIYSRQAVGGIIAPLLRNDKLIDKCLDIVIEQIQKQIEQ